jgi:hypothetical protein
MVKQKGTEIMSKGQAKVGGEVGVNGHFYKGGQFLPTTQAEPGKFKSKKGTGKVEIEPYVWALPEEGMKSLFRSMSPGVFTGKENGVWVMIGSDQTWAYYFGDAETVAAKKAELQARIDAFNAGVRWVKED